MYRNDAIDLAGIRALAPHGVLVSPGPGHPDESGVSLDVIRDLGQTVPVFGVCLGHQSLGQAFGGTVVRHEPVHGKTTRITHDAQVMPPMPTSRVEGDAISGLMARG